MYRIILSALFHRNNMECCPIYSKFDFHSGKTKAIDALRIILVGRSWVLGQEGKKGLAFIFRNLFQKFGRTFNIKGIVFQRTTEAFGSLRVAVYVRKGLMSKIGVPSIKSAPEMWRIGPCSGWVSTASRRTEESPMGFGRKGERVAKTPMRVLPPRRGGRTVGDQLLRILSENPHMSHIWE